MESVLFSFTGTLGMALSVNLFVFILSINYLIAIRRKIRRDKKDRIAVNNKITSGDGLEDIKMPQDLEELNVSWELDNKKNIIIVFFVLFFCALLFLIQCFFYWNDFYAKDLESWAFEVYRLFFILITSILNVIFSLLIYVSNRIAIKKAFHEIIKKNLKQFGSGFNNEK